MTFKLSTSKKQTSWFQTSTRYALSSRKNTSKRTKKSRNPRRRCAQPLKWSESSAPKRVRRGSENWRDSFLVSEKRHRSLQLIKKEAMRS